MRTTAASYDRTRREVGMGSGAEDHRAVADGFALVEDAGDARARAGAPNVASLHGDGVAAERARRRLNLAVRVRGARALGVVQRVVGVLLHEEHVLATHGDWGGGEGFSGGRLRRSDGAVPLVQSRTTTTRPRAARLLGWTKPRGSTALEDGNHRAPDDLARRGGVGVTSRAPARAERSPRLRGTLATSEETCGNSFRAAAALFFIHCGFAGGRNTPTAHATRTSPRKKRSPHPVREDVGRHVDRRRVRPRRRQRRRAQRRSRQADFPLRPPSVASLVPSPASPRAPRRRPRRPQPLRRTSTRPR